MTLMMTPTGADSLASRLELAFDLYGAGERMYRQSLARRHPHADDATLEALVGAWLRERPGAEQGDGSGRPIDPDGFAS